MTKRIHNFIWGFMYIYPLLYLITLLLFPLLNHNFVEYESYFERIFTNSIYLDQIYNMCFYFGDLDSVLGTVLISIGGEFFGLSSYLVSYLTHIMMVFILHISFETIMWLPQFFYRKFLERKE